MRSTGATELQQQLSDFNGLQAQLLRIREQVDAGSMPIPDVYMFFSAMLSGFDRTGIALIENNAPAVGVAVEMTNNLHTLRAVEAMSRSSTLTAATLNESAPLPTPLTAELRNLIGFYHTYFEQLARQPTAEGRQTKSIVESPAWQRLSVTEDAITQPVKTRTATTPALPLSAREWRDAATEVSEHLLELWGTHVAQSLDLAAKTASRDAKKSAVAGSAVLGLAIAAFLVALWLANRLIGRLWRLRVETLALAEVALPETMAASPPERTWTRKPKQHNWISATTNSARWPPRSIALIPPRSALPSPRLGPRRVCGRYSSTSPTAVSWWCTASWRSSMRPNRGKRIPRCWTSSSGSITWPRGSAATPKN